MPDYSDYQNIGVPLASSDDITGGVNTQIQAEDLVSLPMDPTMVHNKFTLIKTENQNRNLKYYLQRQAVQGNFRWPRDWPNHIPKVKHNFCKPISERFATYLMGKLFTTVIERPNTLEFRDCAERSEKILDRLFKLSKAPIQFSAGARSGSVLGRTVFRVYRVGKPGHEHAAFKLAQPDYFYGVPAGDAAAGDENALCFYSYPIDIMEAINRFGPREYRTENEINQNYRYDPFPEEQTNNGYLSQLHRRVPVLEAWSQTQYFLEVGGEILYNGENPFKWSNSGRGFIPFVVIDNIRNEGDTYGESDIEQVRELNEQFNYLISRKQYIVGRWLQPTLVWEGAPQNYLDILTSTIGGGGAIPTRLGSRLYFLAYTSQNPQVAELEQELRTAILETAGLNEIAFQGTVHGYVNSGPSVNAQYQPLMSVIQKKQKAWEVGIEDLCAMLLQIQEDIGDSEALGLAVVNASVSGTKDGSDGEVIQLSGKDIAGLRYVKVMWPGLLPADDASAAQLEMQKAAQGLQSIYTTLEKLGDDYPDDEIQRLRMENQDPSLKGQYVAEQTRANAAMVNAQGGSGPQGPDMSQMDGAGAAAPTSQLAGMGLDQGEQQGIENFGNLGQALRRIARLSMPRLDNAGDEPEITGQSPNG
jgi:hypothetical protein